MPTLILCFHRVADPAHGGRSMLAISPEDFERVLDVVGSRYEWASLEEGARPSRERRAVVTFDDGYADNLYTAAPILLSRGIPATYFVSTGYIGTDLLYPPDALDLTYEGGVLEENVVTDALQLGATYWSALDRFVTLPSDEFWMRLRELSIAAGPRALSSDPYRRPMTLDELRQLANFPGSTIGPHTVSHRRLSSLSQEEAIDEIHLSSKWLESQGYTAVPFFAYPFGQKTDISPVLGQELTRAGLQALTTLPALIAASSLTALGTWGLPRLSVGPREVALLPKILRALAVMEGAPRLWLSVLEIRRRLATARP